MHEITRERRVKSHFDSVRTEMPQLTARALLWSEHPSSVASRLWSNPLCGASPQRVDGVALCVETAALARSVRAVDGGRSALLEPARA